MDDDEQNHLKKASTLVIMYGLIDGTGIQLKISSWMAEVLHTRCEKTYPQKESARIYPQNGAPSSLIRSLIVEE